MIARIFLAAVAVVAVPLAAAGHAQAPAKSRAETRRTCEVTEQIGTRLGRVRRCLTRAEREQVQAEGQQMTDRIQSGKHFSEAMYQAGFRGPYGSGICRAGPRVC